MKLGIISFTAMGNETSYQISEKLNKNNHIIKRFTYEKYEEYKENSFSKANELVGKIFNEYDGIIFIASVGIAVRLIAPYIKDKTTDPAVIVIDQEGKNVISVLSGHIGGANELTKEISDKINANPIITTATDIGGRFSPDSFAKNNDLYITDMKAAKYVAASSARGENIGITIGDNKEKEIFDYSLNLIPRDLFLGIGCKKGTDSEKLKNFILDYFKTKGLDIRRVKGIASIDLKKEERALLDLSNYLNVPFITFSSEELNKINGTFKPSEFVNSITGTDNVCERSAMAALYKYSKEGKIVQEKLAMEGMTLAIAKRDMNIYIE